MLTIATITPSQGEQYYQQENYYSLNAALENSEWWGKGAIALGLSGQIALNVAYKNLVHGDSPDGSQQLRAKPRNKETTERAGVVFTFSAPKSVSLACLVGGDSRLKEAHLSAVKRTLEIIERRYAETTVKGKRISTGNLTVAMWHYDTNRELNPHLHSHCVVMNMTQLPNGEWQRLTDENLYYNKILLGHIYRNELALQCQKLGYSIEAHPKGLFEIKGYTREQIEAFSKRLLLGQLVYTSFPGVGFRVRSSAQVPTQIQQAFIQQVVNQHWDCYNPPRSGYRAAYLHQVTLEHTLFGWLYYDEVDDLGRRVPYFLCYYYAKQLDAVQLENIFTCLQTGPVALIDLQSFPATLETIVAPDLWSYQPARKGVAIPESVRERNHIALKQRRLLDLFVSVDERDIVIELNEQFEKQQSDPLQPSVTATPVPDTKLPTDVQTRIGQGRRAWGQGNKSAFLIGIATGVASALPLIVLPLMFWSYYFLQSPAPASQLPQYQMMSRWK